MKNAKQQRKAIFGFHLYLLPAVVTNNIYEEYL